MSISPTVAVALRFAIVVLYQATFSEFTAFPVEKCRIEDWRREMKKVVSISLQEKDGQKGSVGREPSDAAFV